MNRLMKYVIQLVGFVLLTPFAAVVLLGPIVVPGSFVGMAFDLPDGLGSVLSLVIWMLIYTRTSIGGKIGDYQCRILENSARFFGFSRDSYTGTIVDGWLDEESFDETEDDDFVGSGVCEFFIDEAEEEEKNADQVLRSHLK